MLFFFQFKNTQNGRKRRTAWSRMQPHFTARIHYMLILPPYTHRLYPIDPDLDRLNLNKYIYIRAVARR